MKKFTKLFLILLLSGAALGLQAQYCIPPAWDTGPYTGIVNVTLGTLNNSSTINDGGVEVYTYFNAEPVPDLEIGQQYTIYMTTVGATENNSRVWIDWNQDSDFDDNGEEIAAWNLQAAGPQNQDFTVPAGASTGTTRMRVYTDMSFDQGHILPTPCGYQDTLNHGLMQHGEVEDYDVNVTSSTGIEDNNGNSTAFAIIPNADGNMQIKYYLTHSADVTLDIYNVIGQKISTLTEGEQSAGSYSHTLDKTQLNNTANIYFATLRVDDTIITKKFVLR